MKRRIVCLLLCLCMFISAALMSGCGKTNDDGNTAGTGEDGASALTRSSMTLTLWVPTDKSTTPAALERVEEAINKITQSEFDTAIKLYAVPTDEYEEKIKTHTEEVKIRVEKAEQEAIERRKAEREAAKRGETLPPVETTVEDSASDGLDRIVDSGAGYPHVEKNQIDIFLIRGYEDYMYYTDNMLIQSLTEELSGTGKILKSYIYPSFFDAATVNGSIYAIPNNHALGEYTYLLVNKELAAKYGYSEKELAIITNTQPFVEKVAAGEPGVVPVYGDFDPAYMQYWSGQSSNVFSTIASRVTASTPVEEVKIQNVFDIPGFVDTTYLYKSYSEKGYISNAEGVTNFGIGLVKTTPDKVQELYGDNYYINIHQSPEGNLSDYCSAMFAVSNYSKSLSRSMEIITRLNTSEELRTVLQYGVENVDWKYDELNDEIIVQTSEEYKMNLVETGNVYMTYPNYGLPMDWSASKTQNLDSYYPATYFMTDYVHESNQELIAALDSFNAQIKNEIDSMDAETFKASVSALKAKVENNDAYQKLTYVPSSSDAQKGKTPENGWLPDNSIPYMWSAKLQGN